MEHPAIIGEGIASEVADGFLVPREQPVSIPRSWSLALRCPNSAMAAYYEVTVMLRTHHLELKTEHEDRIPADG